MKSKKIIKNLKRNIVDILKINSKKFAQLMVKKESYIKAQWVEEPLNKI